MEAVVFYVTESFRRIRLPCIVGLLATGVLAGRSGLGLISAVHEVEVMAEIGVIRLLFAIGLEFSLKKLVKVKLIVVIGGFMSSGGGTSDGASLFMAMGDIFQHIGKQPFAVFNHSFLMTRGAKMSPCA